MCIGLQLLPVDDVPGMSCMCFIWLLRKVDEVVDRGLVSNGGVKLVRRFTGGGTVIVNKDTLFSTLIIEVLLILCIQIPSLYCRSLISASYDMLRICYVPFNVSTIANGAEFFVAQCAKISTTYYAMDRRVLQISIWGLGKFQLTRKW